MKRLLTALLFILAAAGSHAQVTSKDWFKRGLALNDSANYEEGVKAFEKSIYLDNKYADAYYRAGWTYNELGTFDKAIERLLKAVELKKDYAFALQELGYAYKKTEKYNEALNHLNKAVTIKPDYAIAYKQLGDVYMKLNRNSEGVTAYEKAYSLDNYYEPPCYELGYWYNGTKNFDKALEWLNKALAIKPAMDTYNEVGFAYYSLKKNDEAIAAYNKALQINPLNGTAYKGIGDVYRRNFKPSKTTEAIENYRKAIKNNPKSSGSYFGLGWCYNELTNYDSSIVNLKKALDLDRTLTVAYTELGYAQYMKGYNTDAISNFNKAIAQNASSSLPVYYKGLVYIVLKDKTNASAMYEQLKPLDNSLADKLLAKINAL